VVLLALLFAEGFRGVVVAFFERDAGVLVAFLAILGFAVVFAAVFLGDDLGFEVFTAVFFVVGAAAADFTASGFASSTVVTTICF
jgi:hypothetical protein